MGQKDLILHAGRPDLHGPPDTDEVILNGEIVTRETPDEGPLAQRSFLS